MGESTVKKVVDMTGMWWPDADSGKLRQVCDAWRAMAEAIDGVTASTNSAAQNVIGGNSGPAIDAFHNFWNRYYNGGSGALPDTAKACRQLATACDQFADEVDRAVHKLEEEATIAGATLVAGTALAIFTAGISEAAAGAATAGIIAAADAVGVTVSETVASIAATTLTGVAFGAVESTAVDALVAQPVRIAFGDGGFSGSELLSAAETGGVMGGAAGGLGAGARSLATAVDGASPALNAVGRIATSLDSMPGRMVMGGGLAAGQDALFNGGHINPLDVILGGVGGAAAPGGRGGEGDPLGGETSRGSGEYLPPRDDVVAALKNADLQPAGVTYTSEDGHYYANRVFAGGRPDGQPVFSGHGTYDAGAGETVVPEGTRISFYVDHGDLLPGLHGVAVERGVYPGSAVETFGPGDTIPNYTLRAPAGTAAMQNSTTVAERTHLSELLKPGMGLVHWAACREIS